MRDRFRAARVLVVGDAMVDEYVMGVVSRISPEAPVPVLDVRSRYFSAGGAANVAMNLASLGAEARLAGLAGLDAAGTALREMLESAGVRVEALVNAGARGTITKTRIVAGQQQICRIDREVRTEIGGELEAALIGKMREAAGDCDTAILSDYGKGTLTEAVCAAAMAMGKPVIVDPKGRDFRKYAGCAAITPNLAEAAAAAGIAIESEESLERAGRALLGMLPGAAVLVTRGAEGMTLFEEGREAFTIPTVARKVFDVVGAGDTAVAVLAGGMAAGLGIREAIVWANRAAGIAVGKPGTAVVAWEELEA